LHNGVTQEAISIYVGIAHYEETVFSLFLILFIEYGLFYFISGLDQVLEVIYQQYRVRFGCGQTARQGHYSVPVLAKDLCQLSFLGAEVFI
jgi:hypothetical protein